MRHHSREAVAAGTDIGNTTRPARGKSLEFRAHAGTLTFGYTCCAGSRHFEGTLEVAVPGLRVDRPGSRVTFALHRVNYPADTRAATPGHEPQGEST